MKIEDKGISFFEYILYKSVANLKFGETSEKTITKMFGKADKTFKEDNGIKTAVYFNKMQIYYDNNEKFYGIHLFGSIKFMVDGKLIEINLNDFKIDDLKKISDDFKLTISEDDYASEKLGIDICFNFDGDYAVGQSILFMCKEYYEKEIEYLPSNKY